MRNGDSRRMGKRLGFSLLFGRKHAEVLMEASSRLAERFHCDYRLGPDSFPHMTILQIETDEAPGDVWDRLGSISRGPVRVPLVGVRLWRDCENGVWIELEVKRTPEIQALHEKAQIAVSGTKILNASGREYRPHITLARVPRADRLLEVPVAALWGREIDGSPSIGILGPRFQFRRPLFGGPER